MKVFISWSGTRSRRTADLLRTWLPFIIQDLEPFVSGEDISKGGNWSEAIIQELNQARFGIICVTPHNLEKPWLLFEAGALSKQVDNEATKVAPLLIGFQGKRDLPPPLGRFQTTLPSKTDMYKLVLSLNDTCQPDRQRDPFSLKTIFEKWWDEFEGPFREIENSHPSSPVRPRSDGEVLAEVLDVVRSLQSQAITQHPKSGVVDMRSASILGLATATASGRVDSTGFPPTSLMRAEIQKFSFEFLGERFEPETETLQALVMDKEEGSHVEPRFDLLQERLAEQFHGKVRAVLLVAG